MTVPNTLAARLKISRENKGLSQARLAKAAGVSQAAIGAIEAERNKSSTHIATLAMILGVNPIWLETGKGEMAFNQNVANNFGDNATIGNSNNFGIVQHSGSLKNSEPHSQIGDNAFHQPLPHIPEGSEIWVDENQTDIVDGKIYLVECGGKRYYRRVFSQPETQEILLNTDNPLFPNKKMPMDKVKIIGRVTAWKVTEK